MSLKLKSISSMPAAEKISTTGAAALADFQIHEGAPPGAGPEHGPELLPGVAAVAFFVFFVDFVGGGYGGGARRQGD